jgi:hypothetical protein
MKSHTRFSGVVAGLITCLTIAPAALAAGYFSPRPTGAFLPQVWDEASTQKVDRVVNITPGTKSVGVYRNELVKFIDASSGHAVIVRADTPDGAFSLNQVAGPDFAGGKPILVYVRDTVGDANG